MKKNKIILLVLLFFTLAGFGFTAFAQQGECVQNFETTLAYGENWYERISTVDSNNGYLDINTIITWSFIGNNPDVGITAVLTLSEYDDNQTHNSYLLANGASQASGKDHVIGDSFYIVLWHMDETAQAETTTISIQFTVTLFYFDTPMILIYIGSVLFIVIVTVSIVVPVRKRKKKKALQETVHPSSSFPSTISQPDYSSSDLPPPPPSEFESDKIFCWKCGQPNTAQTSYCIKCGSDIHNPER